MLRNSLMATGFNVLGVGQIKSAGWVNSSSARTLERAACTKSLENIYPEATFIETTTGVWYSALCGAPHKAEEQPFVRVSSTGGSWLKPAISFCPNSLGSSSDIVCPINSQFLQINGCAI
jgi:hypothetical protein